MSLSKIFTLFLLLAISINLSAQASQKTPQIITLPKGIVELHIQAESDKVQIVKTKGSRISIEANVKIGAGSTPLLKYLIDNGRYSLTAKSDYHKHTLTLSPQKNKKILLIKGQECSEEVIYKIHVPESVKFVKTLSTSNNNSVAYF
jgi:hypothetical protein